MEHLLEQTRIPKKIRVSFASVPSIRDKHETRSEKYAWVAASGEFRFGDKIKRARESRRPRVTRNDLVELAKKFGLADFDYHAVESVERNQSEKKARQLIPVLLEAWDEIGEDWYWDGKDTQPPAKFSTLLAAEALAEYDVGDEHVDITLHVATKSGKVIKLSKGSGTTSVPAGLAKGNTFAIRIADTENAPRFLPGNVVIFRPQDIYEDGCFVAVEHPDDLVEMPGGEHLPRLYVRWYVYEGGRFVLKGRNPEAPVFEANDVRILGRAISLVEEYADDWKDYEIRHKGLPWDKPGGSR